MAWQTLDQQYEQQNNRNDRSNYLKDIIAGLSIATNNDPMTLLGYGISKFLSNYVNRGLERRQQEKNQKAYDEATGAAAQPQAQPQPQTTGGLLENLPADETLQIAKGTPFVSDAARSLMPNIDWQNRGGAPSFFDKAASENKPQQAALENPAAPQPTQNENIVSEIANQISRQPTRSPQDFSMTSEEVYKRAFDIARANGSTMDQARQFAQQQAGLYQSKRVDSLAGAFLDRGVGQDGTITRDGVRMLAQIAQERPEMVNMLGNMFQSPQGATKHAQDIAKMMANSDLHLKNAKEMAGINFGYQQRGADAQMQRQMALYDYKAQLDGAVRQGRQQEALQMAIQLGKAQGLSDEQALVNGLGYVLGGGGGSGRGNGGRGKGSGDNTDKEHFSRLDKWLERYGKENRDPVTGEWNDGFGPGDPEYDERIEQYNRYTAKQYDADDYEDAIRITQSLIDKGYPAEGIIKYVDEKFGDLAPSIKKDLNLQ